MELETQPDIISFVIRFVKAPCEGGKKSDDWRSYRGAIRHVQTDKEFVFTLWDDAVNFIQHYIPLTEQIQKE